MTNLTTKLSSLSKLACLGLALFTAACGDTDGTDSVEVAEDEAVFELEDVVLYTFEAEFAEEIQRAEHYDLEAIGVTQVGDAWNDDCNLCVLTKTGAICTAQACEDFDPDLADVATTCEDGEYYEGEIWMESCNMCKCTDMGSICTLKECDPESIPH